MLFAIHCLSVTNSVIHPPPCTGMVICVGQRWSQSELVPRAAVPAICGQCLWSINVSGYLLLLLLALWHLSLGRRTGAALFLPHNAYCLHCCAVDPLMSHLGGSTKVEVGCTLCFGKK